MYYCFGLAGTNFYLSEEAYTLHCLQNLSSDNFSLLALSFHLRLALFFHDRLKSVFDDQIEKLVTAIPTKVKSVRSLGVTSRTTRRNC